VSIVQIGSWPPPHGGQSVHVRNLTSWLRAQGEEVRVLNTGVNKSVCAPGVANVSSGRALLGHLLRGAPCRLAHVHVSTPEDYGKLAPVAAAAAMRGFPWVATIHSGESAGRMRRANALRRSATRALLARADAVVCVNDAIRDALSAWLNPARLVTIAPFSVDFTGGALPGDLQAFCVTHEPLITCTGWYEPVYGFDDAVRLMSRVRQHWPDAGLALIGDLRGAQWCARLVAEQGLQGHVHLCGNLEHAQCLAAMQRSALFLRPTRFDGDALSVREALSLGVPVVASTTDFRPPGVILYRRDCFEDLVARVMGALGTQNMNAVCCTKNTDNLKQLRDLYLAIADAREKSHVRNLRQV
jgi:glycosyltransferase involved in cell wall biosynthesis